MANGQRRSNNDDKPYEEFINDDQNMHREEVTQGQRKYEQWSIKELQEEAEKYGIVDSIQMKRSDLIRALKNYDKPKRHFLK